MNSIRKQSSSFFFNFNLWGVSYLNDSSKLTDNETENTEFNKQIHDFWEQIGDFQKKINYSLIIAAIIIGFLGVLGLIPIQLIEVIGFSCSALFLIIILKYEPKISSIPLPHFIINTKDEISTQVNKQVQKSLADITDKTMTQIQEQTESFQDNLSSIENKHQKNLEEKIEEYVNKINQLEEGRTKITTTGRILQAIKVTFHIFNIKVSPTLQLEYLEKNEKQIGNETQIDTFVRFITKALNIDEGLIRFFSKGFLSPTLSEAEIKNNPKLIKSLIKIIAGHRDLRDNNLVLRILPALIRTTKTLDIDELIEDTTFILKELWFLDIFLEYSLNFNLKFEEDLKYAFLLSKKDVIKDSNKATTIVKLGFEAALELLSNYWSKFSENQIDIIKIYCFGFFKIKLPEFFKTFCEQTSAGESYLTLLYVILSRFKTVEPFFLEFNQNPSVLGDILQKIKDQEIDLRNEIRIFRQEYHRTNIIIDKETLYRIYVYQTEERLGMVDYLFKKYGEIDYRKIYEVVVNCSIPNEYLLRILRAQDVIRPYILTFGDGGAPFVNNVYQQNLSFFFVKYTTAARIGIIPQKFLDLKQFRDNFLRGFVKDYFRIDQEHIIKVIDQMQDWQKATQEEITKYLKINDLDKISQNREYLLKLNDLIQRIQEEIESLRKVEKFSGLPRFSQDLFSELEIIFKDNDKEWILEDFQPNFDILFHYLSADEGGFQTIGYGEKGDALTKIKEVFSRDATPEISATGMIIGKLPVKNTAFTLRNIMEFFIQNSSFLDLINANAIGGLDNLCALLEDSKNKKLKTIFDQGETKECLKNINDKILNFKDLGEYIKRDMKIGHLWNAELFLTNQSKFNTVLGNYSSSIENFWREKINRISADLSPKNEKFKKSLQSDELYKNLDVLAVFALKLITYFSIVVIPDLEQYDIDDSSEAFQKFHNSIHTAIEEKKLIPLLEDVQFEQSLAIFERFANADQLAPFHLDYTKNNYIELSDKSLEHEFQNYFMRFAGYYIGRNNLRREEDTANDKIDFLFYNRYDAECKIRQKNDNNLETFLGKHLKQVAEYESRLKEKVGFFLYYDRSEKLDLPSDATTENFFIREQKLSPTPEGKINSVIIFIMRISSYTRLPSGGDRYKRRQKR